MAFRLQKVFFESRDLNFIFEGNNTNNNHFTIIIGQNGIGKSRLLSGVAKTFKGLDTKRNRLKSNLDFEDRKKSDFSLQYEINGELVNLALHNRDILKKNYSDNNRPKKVICATSSPFDKFPVSKYYTTSNALTEEEFQSTIYKYLGSKNNLGQFSSKTQIKRFIESLVFAVNKSQTEIKKLSNVFEFLGYRPRMKAVYRIEGGLEFFNKLANLSSANEFFEINKNISSRFYDSSYIDNFVKNEPKIISQVKDAARIIIRSIDNENRRIVPIELNFVDQIHNQASLEVFFATTLLGKFGLLYLHDVELFKDDKHKKGISIKEASSGEQCIVVTTLGIASEISNNCLICIDEPEISLHPEWQEKYIELLTETFSTFSGCHFILATHSPQILSRVKSEDSNVLLMDEGKLYPASDYAKRSADFQLVEAFKAPGYKNEYLAREALTVYSNLKPNGKLDSEYEEQYELLLENKNRLEPDDPIAKLINAIITFRGKSHQ